MDHSGKRVSFVELYLDLVFVLAVGQLAHLIVAEPRMRTVWIALGLFFALWWTWVGFAVLYNRRGTDSSRGRLLILVGSVPAGVAAVAVERASTGDSVAFALSLAAVRLVLGAAYGGSREGLGARIVRACMASAILFAVSAVVPAPFRYILWAVAISVESGAYLAEDKQAARTARRDRDFSAMKPTDPEEALDAHHFAERFGLFLIILLGELVVEAGQASGAVADWGSIAAAMVLAGALWWLYFDAVADANRRVLELSGGSPTMARAVFAVGHMLPAFALLLVAAGVGLLLEEQDAPLIAFRLAAFGTGIYLLSSRAILMARGRVPTAVRVLVVVATFSFGLLHGIGAHAYLTVFAAWVVGCAALATRDSRSEADPISA